MLALGCAPQALVVGDGAQLPPPSFLRPAPPETPLDEPETLTRGFTSVADALRPVLPTRRLRWNHRATNVDLVRSADGSDADGAVLSFPAAQSERGVRHVVVEPSPGERDVAREAERVVDLVVEQAAARPHESLAIVTFGRPHAERIAAAMRRRAPHDPRSRGPDGATEPLLLGSVEAVQGHERDAVILATGYANRGPDGLLRATFGPLTSVGGERRLQVALTRARRRLTVVTSFTADELAATATRARGIRDFHRVLHRLAAEDGPTLATVAPDGQDPLIEDMLTRLRAAGLPARWWRGDRRCGVDLEVLAPGSAQRGVLAIGTDDERWLALGPPAVREILVPGLLACRGWVLHRIAGSDWLDAPDLQVARTVEAYGRALGGASDAERGPPPRAGRLLT